jgi:predicted transcriptional regulator
VAEIRIPTSLAKRLDAYASARGEPRELVARQAIERQIEFDAWWEREVTKGIVEADAGRLVPAERVLKRARRLLSSHARRKAAR